MSKNVVNKALNTVLKDSTYDTYDDDNNDSFVEAKYKNFIIENGKFYPNENGKVLLKLKPGSYSLHFDPMSKTFWFEKMKIVSDDILDLPSPEYEQIIREMNFFIEPKTKEKFVKLGFVYKRSVLLHGEPGTGKTVISNRIARDLIKSGGVVLWVTDPNLLVLAFSVLKDIQPETLTGVIFEEFDEISRRNESMLLTLLDGQVQKENVMYLATTNYLEKVSKRLYRPGRFSSVIKVNFPTADARRLYLVSKLEKDFADLEYWVDKTNGLSIDELKEMVQAVYILQNPFQDVLKRIKETKGIEYEEPEKDENYLGPMKYLLPSR